MNRFYIWTIGCQMNKADSLNLSAELERMGYRPVSTPEEADIVVLNSCVVRQSAEDKVVNKLTNLKALKKTHPGVFIALTGCMVNSGTNRLKERFEHVDAFFKPQQFRDLLSRIETRSEPGPWSPARAALESVTAYIPIIQGCNNFCSYCIVPYRRGREKSRPMAEIIREVVQYIECGIREITLLGQNVDSYGHDLPDRPDLADLLTEVNQIDGLERIRFLTSHPKDMNRKLIEAVASLERVCEHISLPAQAGDNEILQAMRRGYTIEQYVALIGRIRATIPHVALSNDIIVGFPGETAAQFGRTYDLLEKLQFDAVHVAAYSPRPGTIASRKLKDNVSAEEKQDRLKRIEVLQESTSRGINHRLVNRKVEVLVEGKKGTRWQGRTRGDKLVFFEDHGDWYGKLAQVNVTHAGAWSLQGTPLIESAMVAGTK